VLQAVAPPPTKKRRVCDKIMSDVLSEWWSALGDNDISVAEAELIPATVEVRGTPAAGTIMKAFGMGRGEAPVEAAAPQPIEPQPQPQPQPQPAEPPQPEPPQPEPPQPEPPDPNKTARLRENSVLLSIEFNRMGNSRKIPRTKVQVDAKADRVDSNKKLLDSDVLAEITAFDQATANYVKARQLPSPFRRKSGGIYAYPRKLIRDTVRYLKERQGPRDQMIRKYFFEPTAPKAWCAACSGTGRPSDEALMEGTLSANCPQCGGRRFTGGTMYEQDTAQARVDLNGLFNESDYPPPEEAMARFATDYQVIDYNAPDGLRDTDPEIYEEEARKVAAQWAEATELVRSALAEGLRDLVATMVERLGVETEGKRAGKPKVFRDSLVSNFSEFLQVFDARNVTGEDDLARIAATCRGLLAGVEPDTLRSNEDVRKTVADGMAAAAAALESMIVDAPVRMMRLED
jgi:hypothetical protein